jgi:hypothetical protein
MLKLSYRDKVIAIILTVVLLLAIGGIFLVKPQIEKYQAKQIEVKNKEAEKVTVEEKIATLDSIQQSIIRAAYDIGDLQEPFYIEAKHYELEQLFHEYVDSADMEIQSIDFDLSSNVIVASQFKPSYNILAYTMKMNADLYGTLPEDVMNIWNKVSLVQKPTVQIGVFNIGLTVADVETWEDARPLIDEIFDLERTIMINNISPAVESNVQDEEAAITGSGLPVNITLYHIVPMDKDTVVENELDVAEENGGIEKRQEFEAFIETLEEEYAALDEGNAEETPLPQE